VVKVIDVVGNDTVTLAPVPNWPGIHDDQGRLLVTMKHNRNIDDYCKEADTSDYPDRMTVLGYLFAINYIVCAMTH
jgi:hypothetical protein